MTYVRVDRQCTIRQALAQQRVEATVESQTSLLYTLKLYHARLPWTPWRRRGVWTITGRILEGPLAPLGRSSARFSLFGRPEADEQINDLSTPSQIVTSNHEIYRMTVVVFCFLDLFPKHRKSGNRCIP